MAKCPIQNCGRQFQNEQTMLQHAKRRHALQYQQIQNHVNEKIFSKQQQINTEMKKLPKMNKLLEQQKATQEKAPIEYQRRSMSKKRKQGLGLNSKQHNYHSQANGIVQDSRNAILLEQKSNNDKHNISGVLGSSIGSNSSKKPSLMNKRPSLSKRNSSGSGLGLMASVTSTSWSSQRTDNSDRKNPDKLPSIITPSSSKVNNNKRSSKLQTTTDEIPNNYNSTVTSVTATINKSTSRQQKSRQSRQKLKSRQSKSKNRILQGEEASTVKNEGNERNEKSHKGQLFESKTTKEKVIMKLKLKPMDTLAETESKQLGQRSGPGQIQTLGQGHQYQQHKPLLAKKLLQRQSSKKGQQLQLLKDQYQQRQQGQNKQTYQSQQQKLQQKKFSFQKKKVTVVGKIADPAQSQLQSNNKLVVADRGALQQQWGENIVSISHKNFPSQHLRIPDFAEVEYLFIKHCKLKSVDLNQCFSLREIDLSHNCLTDFSFLKDYDENNSFSATSANFVNLESIYLDHNKVESLETLLLNKEIKLKCLSMSFNSIDNLENVLKVLSEFPQLQELDLSFNPVRKEPNYKYAVLSICQKLMKLDKMKVTSIDRQIASEYKYMYYQELGLIPLNSAQPQKKSTLLQSPLATRPMTVGVSLSRQTQGLKIGSGLESQSRITVDHQNLATKSNKKISKIQKPLKSLLQKNLNNFSEQQSLASSQQLPFASQAELDKEIDILEKMVKHTKSQFQIIRNENEVLQQEIENIDSGLTQRSKQDNDLSNPKLYKKLCKELEQLQLLNYMQYASEEQIEQLTTNKLKSLGLNQGPGKEQSISVRNFIQ